METCSASLAICVGNSPVAGECPSQSQRRGALMFSLRYARINSWVNNREAGDLRPHHAHNGVILMILHIDCLVQDCSNSCALTLELLQSCTNPSIWFKWFPCLVHKNRMNTFIITHCCAVELWMPSRVLPSCFLNHSPDQDFAAHLGRSLGHEFNSLLHSNGLRYYVVVSQCFREVKSAPFVWLKSQFVPHPNPTGPHSVFTVTNDTRGHKAAFCKSHYNDVIMSAETSQITGVSIVYSTIYPGAHERKHRIPASLALVRGSHRWPVNSHTKSR